MAKRLYLFKWGFSLNEGRFPNLYINFVPEQDDFILYCALSPKLRIILNRIAGKLRVDYETMRLLKEEHND